MFTPPFCPQRDCKFHRGAPSKFYDFHGSFNVKCRSRPVPRFRCRACRRTFSRQTFRADYRDHKPHLNAPLFRSLINGTGLRQSGRTLGLSLRCTELKARKLGRHLRRLNLNLLAALPGDAALQFDELETYEGRRNTRPLSISFLIEAKSRVVLWAESATIRPSGSMPKRRKEAIARDQRRFGVRKDLSHRAARRTWARARPLVKRLRHLLIDTDRKSTYPGLIREAFAGLEQLVVTHRCTSSKLARDVANPLFPVNHVEAIARDLTGRLRREGWLVSKHRRFLDIGLHLFIAYRNWIRRRFNHDPRSSAERLGWIRRRLSFGEALSWRQTDGPRSLHPLGRGRCSVEEIQARLGVSLG